MTEASRILVVEDDETLRETLGEVMSDDGHDVRLAANGREALQQLAEWDADVVILDLMMPLMDAFEFRARQRQVAPDSRARVLVLSAARDIESAADRLQANAWLAKPFTLDEMVEAVNRLLGAEAPRRNGLA